MTGQTSFALRKIQEHLRSPTTLIALAGVALLLGLSGPFDTFSGMRPGPRLIYWAIVVFLTYATGYSVAQIVSGHLSRLSLNRWVRTGLGGMAAGVGVGLVLGAINALALESPRYPTGGVQIFGLTIVISMIVTTFLEAALPCDSPPRQAAPTGPVLPPLLDRLPLDKRGALVSLSVSDHYVNVVTSKGREMILLRLSDAIRETAPARGLQVHRSHWVAVDQVTDARRTGETARLTTSAGDDIPVSRTYIRALRETGLLPVERRPQSANG